MAKSDQMSDRKTSTNLSLLNFVSVHPKRYIHEFNLVSYILTLAQMVQLIKTGIAAENLFSQIVEKCFRYKNSVSRSALVS